jgi:hypothetical protein
VVKHLVDAGVTRAGVITAFHERRVLPLMRRARHLDEMVPNAPLEGTMLVMGGLDQEEIKRRIKSVLGIVPPDAVLNVHPPMRPDDDFIEMVSIPILLLLLLLLLLLSCSLFVFLFSWLGARATTRESLLSP